MFFDVKKLMLLLTKNFKQKRFNKKLSYKYTKLFKIKNKINLQIYRLTLFDSYRIYNTFYVLLLIKYYYRVNNKITKFMLQISELINNKKQ